jgi:hypothetical protein
MGFIRNNEDGTIEIRMSNDGTSAQIGIGKYYWIERFTPDDISKKVEFRVWSKTWARVEDTFEDKKSAWEFMISEDDEEECLQYSLSDELSEGFVYRDWDGCPSQEIGD